MTTFASKQQLPGVWFHTQSDLELMLVIKIEKTAEMLNLQCGPVNLVVNTPSRLHQAARRLLINSPRFPISS